MSDLPDWRTSLTAEEREVLDILALAHVRLDARGVPRTAITLEPSQ